MEEAEYYSISCVSNIISISISISISTIIIISISVIIQGGRAAGAHGRWTHSETVMPGGRGAMYVYIYIYIYIHTHTYTYIHIHICIIHQKGPVAYALIDRRLSSVQLPYSTLPANSVK